MTKTISIGVALLLAAIAAAGMQTSVSAATNSNYPYANTACVHAPYRRSGGLAEWCAGYEWGRVLDSNARSSIISPLGYAYRNCTDYAAWRMDQAGVSPGQYRGLGNAKTWAERAAAKGIAVDDMPAELSVAVRTTGQYGHVAVVEQVHPDGTITVAQYNKQATGVFSVQTGTPASLGFTHFVHFVPPALVQVTEPPPQLLMPTEPVVPLSPPEPMPANEPIAKVEAAVVPVVVSVDTTTPPVSTPTPSTTETTIAALTPLPPVLPPPIIAISVPAPVHVVVIPDVPVPSVAPPIPAAAAIPPTAVPAEWWPPTAQPPPFQLASSNQPVHDVWWPVMGLLVLTMMRELSYRRFTRVRLLTVHNMFWRHTRATH